MSRRIFGLETEFGVTCSTTSGRAPTPEEIARYLFRKVVAWGRSSNVFLGNGSRLYLDVGSHPEYATAECDDIHQLLVHDKAGEVLMSTLVDDAQERLEADGIDGRIHLFKNNLDSADNSYGCHENYLLRRRADFARTTDQLVPFLITRQILTGAGHVRITPSGSRYVFSQRSDHMWEATSSATTRSRPIINTRDEPHADADKYRRLHVISGDSSMSHASTMLKVGMTDLVLRLLEAGAILPDLILAEPVRSIRAISHDLTATTQLPLAGGGTASALDAQRAYLDRVRAHLGEHGSSSHDDWVVDLWQRGLDALAGGDLSAVETELDWVIKKRLIDRYVEAGDRALTDPRVRRLDLAYHDISPRTGIFHRLMERGLATRLASEQEIEAATTTPPQTTRAKLRGDFVTAATANRRDYTVDWVHLKVNDQSGRTVLCKDPFIHSDERVDRLIELVTEPGGGR
ncbi:Pup--protein ligase [Pseudactinotalea sp. HY158]|uniref:Pup--protein ligase n=1 Tax=Pseudactinotalea sp. HY158 TaxID=2654547 RepID=UPI00129C6CCB|nr:Pup--protein ligase [Pseudactinotalea sp. HY158]QGH69169.1 Pup--protein ligase [Pseudactinotalea sp. HY158]